MHSLLQTARQVGSWGRLPACQGRGRLEACPTARLFLALALIGSVAAISGGTSARDAPDASEIKKLIEQLGDDKARVRQEASKKLEAIGEPALAPLRAAAASHSDADVRLRAAVLAAA